MSHPERSAHGSARREFLTRILEAQDNRRTSLDNRCAILLTANAVLLTGITGFGVPLATAGVVNTWLWIKLAFAVLALISSVISVLLAGQVIAPIGSQKQRKRIMELESPELNVCFFLKIAECKKADYLNALASLTEEQMVEQLASDAHNVSRLLQYRYPLLSWAYRAFVVSVLAFAILTLASLLT